MTVVYNYKKLMCAVSPAIQENRPALFAKRETAAIPHRTKKVYTMKTSNRLQAHIKIGHSSMDTIEIVTGLNGLLAGLNVFRQKLQHFKWNTEGRDTYSLMSLLNELQTITNEGIDDTSERIRFFGKNPLSRLVEYLETSAIKETEKELTVYAMVKEVIHDIETFDQEINHIISTSSKYDDNATAVILSQFLIKIGKPYLMLRAWTKESL